MSADYETTEELLGYYASSRGYELSGAGSFPQLPWIPQTTVAVALKLLELDASISYVKQQKAEPCDSETVEPPPKLTFKYACEKNILKAETSELYRHGPIKEGDRGYTLGSSRYRPMVHKRGSCQSNAGKSRKRDAGLILESGGHGIRQGETLAQALIRQGERIHGQTHTRGPRTLRRRRTEKMAFEGALPGYLADKGTHQVTSNAATIEGENDGTSNTMEARDFDVGPNMMVETSDGDANDTNENNDYDKGGEIMKEDLMTNGHDSDGNSDGVKDDYSNSLIFGNYSD